MPVSGGVAQYIWRRLSHHLQPSGLQCGTPARCSMPGRSPSPFPQFWLSPSSWLSDRVAAERVVAI